MNNGLHLFTEHETTVIRYLRQFHVSSSTYPWITGWYDEGAAIHLEARDVVNLGNATRLIFDAWLKDETTLRENPVTLKVDSSFRIDSKYRRQYLLTLYSERDDVEGGGWYDEGATAEISVEAVEVGALPFK